MMSKLIEFLKNLLSPKNIIYIPVVPLAIVLFFVMTKNDNLLVNDKVTDKVLNESQRVELAKLKQEVNRLEEDSIKDIFLKEIHQIENSYINTSSSEKANDSNSNYILLVFGILAGVIVYTISSFFTSTFNFNKTNSSAGTIHERLDKKGKSENLDKSYNFLQWILSDNLTKKHFNNNNFALAENLKALYDYSEQLGENRGHFLTLIEDSIKKIKSDNESNEKYEDAVFIFEDIQKRLKEECNRLNKQALINLYLAFSIAFVLVCFILYMSFFSNAYISNWNTFIIKYFPRFISFVSLITIFLYFIKLYKTNIIDVKYYQNELTNIEQKFVAFQTAVNADNSPMIDFILKDLIAVERNTVLSPGQNSIEIERLKIENELNKGYLDKFFEVFSFLKRNNTGS